MRTNSRRFISDPSFSRRHLSGSKAYFDIGQKPSSKASRLSPLGQERRFDAPTTASGLPQSTDIIRPSQLVRLVPKTDVSRDFVRCSERSRERELENPDAVDFPRRPRIVSVPG